MCIASLAMCDASLGPVAPGAAAQTWTESPDAGELPAGAQAPSGVGALTTITGTIPATNDNDADMYRFAFRAPSTRSRTTSSIRSSSSSTTPVSGWPRTTT